MNSRYCHRDMDQSINNFADHKYNYLESASTCSTMLTTTSCTSSTRVGCEGETEDDIDCYDRRSYTKPDETDLKMMKKMLKQKTAAADGDNDDDVQLGKTVERFQRKLQKERDAWIKEKHDMKEQLYKLKKENAMLKAALERAEDEKEDYFEKSQRLNKLIKGCDGGTCRMKLRAQEVKLKEKKEAMLRSMMCMEESKKNSSTMDDTVATSREEEEEDAFSSYDRKQSPFNRRRSSTADKVKSFFTGGGGGTSSSNTASAKRKSSKTFGFFRGSRDLVHSGKNPQSDSFTYNNDPVEQDEPSQISGFSVAVSLKTKLSNFVEEGSKHDDASSLVASRSHNKSGASNVTSTNSSTKRSAKTQHHHVVNGERSISSRRSSNEEDTKRLEAILLHSAASISRRGSTETDSVPSGTNSDDNNEMTSQVISKTMSSQSSKEHRHRRKTRGKDMLGTATWHGGDTNDSIIRSLLKQAHHDENEQGRTCSDDSLEKSESEEVILDAIEEFPHAVFASRSMEAKSKRAMMLEAARDTSPLPYVVFQEAPSSTSFVNAKEELKEVEEETSFSSMSRIATVGNDPLRVPSAALLSSKKKQSSLSRSRKHSTLTRTWHGGGSANHLKQQNKELSALFDKFNAEERKRDQEKYGTHVSCLKNKQSVAGSSSSGRTQPRPAGSSTHSNSVSLTNLVASGTRPSLQMSLMASNGTSRKNIYKEIESDEDGDYNDDECFVPWNNKSQRSMTSKGNRTLSTEEMSGTTSVVSSNSGRSSKSGSVTPRPTREDADDGVDKIISALTVETLEDLQRSDNERRLQMMEQNKSLRLSSVFEDGSSNNHHNATWDSFGGATSSKRHNASLAEMFEKSSSTTNHRHNRASLSTSLHGRRVVGLPAGCSSHSKINGRSYHGTSMALEARKGLSSSMHGMSMNVARSAGRNSCSYLEGLDRRGAASSGGGLSTPNSGKPNNNSGGGLIKNKSRRKSVHDKNELDQTVVGPDFDKVWEAPSPRSEKTVGKSLMKRVLHKTKKTVF